MADPSLKDIAYRGLAATLGSPVDLATMVMRPFGYKTPDAQVVGGSEWIGKQLEDIGLVSTARAPLQEFAASMMVPAASIAGALKYSTKLSPNMVKSLSRLNGVDNVNKAERPVEQALRRAEVDYEGRPLGAEFVVGRRLEGGGEYPLEFAEQLEATKKLGATWREATQSELGRNTIGRFVRSSSQAGDVLREILLKKGLEGKAEGVYAHEFSHLIDDLVYGGTSTKNNKKAFAEIYSELNNPFRGRKQYTAKDAGYKGDDIDREHVAEAIRLYLQNPVYIKEKYPEAARVIRDHVNSNKNINRIVQFNSAAFAPFLAVSMGEFDGVNQ